MDLVRLDFWGLPLSILEAMSVGLPVVASNVIGNSDTIEHGKSGYLYKLGDLNNAIELIKKLAMSESLRKNIGNNSYLRQRSKFSEESMAQNYSYLYQSIINKKNC